MSKINPTVLIIFGVTGDLMAKKIAGSIFHLYLKNKLPRNFRIIGFSRRDIPQEDFKEYIKKITKKSTKIRYSEKQLDDFCELFYYQQGNFHNKVDYNNLGALLNKFNRDLNRLFYLATPPVLYEEIFENLSESRIAREDKNSWTRIIVEKPFGSNLKTAERLDNLLGRLFKEDQIYRIDHYLGKDILQNILAFRFSNNLLEHSWNKHLIEKIEVRLFEKEGVEDRADTYDPVGALKDVGQNHILQMLSLVTMDNPTPISAKTVREERAKILQSLKKLTERDIKKNTIRGQYLGYKTHEGVRKGSHTETYFKITAAIKATKWRNVPVILESGKKMNEQRKEIVVTFKHAEPCLCPPGDHFKNKVIFTLEPREEITIVFWAKKPGLEMRLEERSLDFGYRTSEDDYTAEYEKLFLDCITGDQTLFVSTEEVRAMWKFIDPIIKGWHKNIVPLTTYKPQRLPTIK
jgi:glucose-6-phosphate 1-dehydrogenase